jgi:hypothetical protein
MLEDFSVNSYDTYPPCCFLDEVWIVAKNGNSNDTAYYKGVDKKHGNFLSVKVYLGE